MHHRATVQSERPSFAMGAVAVAVGVGSVLADAIARRLHRPGAHRFVEPEPVGAPRFEDVPRFEFEHELERLLADAARPHAHA